MADDTTCDIGTTDADVVFKIVSSVAVQTCAFIQADRAAVNQIRTHGTNRPIQEVVCFTAKALSRGTYITAFKLILTKNACMI